LRTGASAGLSAIRDASGGLDVSGGMPGSGRLDGGGGFDAGSGLKRRGHGGLGAEAVLRLATLGGACALGLGSEVGSIEVGKAADLVCIDLSGLACQPPRRPAEAVVFGATRHQVSDVWTSGRAAVRDGRLLTIDEQEMRTLARCWAEQIATGATYTSHGLPRERVPAMGRTGDSREVPWTDGEHAGCAPPNDPSEGEQAPLAQKE